MKRFLFPFIALFAVTLLHAQTVENIRVVQDGVNLQITYRIGASTSDQIFNVYMTCSMDGANRFEPKAVMGDVGQNIVGGKSFYTIIWDVFLDVEELNNPDFTIRLELVEDNTPTRFPTETQPAEEVQEQPAEPEPEPAEQINTEKAGDETTRQDETFQPGFSEVEKRDKFERDAFFCFSLNPGIGIPFGVSFGSLKNWGYYVSPIRFGLGSYFYLDEWNYSETDFILHLMVTAGVTKHLFSAGWYRMHAYAGLGGHLSVEDITTSPYSRFGLMPEAGIVNVLSRFNINAGLSYSTQYFPSYTGATNLHFVLGAGFVF
jgi:hypothetical protein